MGVRACRFRAKRMVLALLGGMGEHAAQFGARQAELALWMPIGTFVSKFARREGTVPEQKGEISYQAKRRKSATINSNQSVPKSIAEATDSCDAITRMLPHK